MRRSLVLIAVLLAGSGPALPARKHRPTLAPAPNPTAVSLGRTTEVTVSIHDSKLRRLRLYVCDGNGASCVKKGAPSTGTVAIVSRRLDKAVVRYSAPASTPADTICIPDSSGCGITLRTDFMKDKKKVVASSTAALHLLGDPPERGRSRIVRTGHYPAEIAVDEARQLLFATATGATSRSRRPPVPAVQEGANRRDLLPIRLDPIRHLV